MIGTSICRLTAIAAQLCFVALLSFAILMAVWSRNFTSIIVPFERFFREILPHGEVWPWSSTTANSWNVFTPLQSNGWRALLSWLDSTPWPILILLLLLGMRIITWCGVRAIANRLLIAKVNVALRAGTLLESAAFVFWVTVAAIAWRLWWGMNWDQPAGTVATWFPTETGPVHITLLCIGAALGYGWMIAILVDRSISQLPQSPRCVHCGYSLIGLCSLGRCPECGHDQASAERTSALTRILRQLPRNACLIIGLALLCIPYISALAARVLV